MNREGDVIVFLEPDSDGGEWVNQGLLTEGSRIAALLGARLGAFTCGPGKPDTALIEGYGASILYSVEGEGLVAAGANQSPLPPCPPSGAFPSGFFSWPTATGARTLPQWWLRASGRPR